MSDIYSKKLYVGGLLHREIVLEKRGKNSYSITVYDGYDDILYSEYYREWWVALEAYKATKGIEGV